MALADWRTSFCTWQEAELRLVKSTTELGAEGRAQACQWLRPRRRNFLWKSYLPGAGTRPEFWRRGTVFMLTWPSRELSDGSHRTASSRVPTRKPVPSCKSDSSLVKTERTHSGPGIRMEGEMYLKPQPRATPFLHVST